MKVIFAIFCLLLGMRSSACIQFYVVDELGHKHLFEGGEHSPGDIFPGSYLAQQVQERQKAALAARGEQRFIALADYAAALLRAGCSEEAVPILEKLLKDHPNEYNLYANLAVAYELLGQTDKALVFLNRSMEINPSSHQNSEWFHKRILEYVQGQKGNSGDFSAGNVLGISNTRGEKLLSDIAYQLQERLPLTPAPNELLSRVIEECADYYRKNISLEWALKLYAISIAYSTDQSRKLALQQRSDALMPKLFELHRKHKVDLLVFSKNKCAKQFADIITQWSVYKPYEYDGPLVDIEW